MVLPPLCGEEACAVGACSALEEKIYNQHHRGHGHCISKGIDLNRMMAELWKGNRCVKARRLNAYSRPVQGQSGANGVGRRASHCCRSTLTLRMKSRIRLYYASSRWGFKRGKLSKH